MNSSHTVKKASQEISYITDQVHQIEGEAQSDRLIEVLFLNDLPKEYEGSCQLLEFRARCGQPLLRGECPSLEASPANFH